MTGTADARRTAASILGLLVATLLLPLGALSPANAESGEARPGVPRADASAVAAGGLHACAIVADGSLRCWGYNGFGQLGQGNTAAVGDTPGESTVAVNLGPGRTAVAVAAGGYHTCAILDTGQLHCWGSNTFGQLGQGNNTHIGDTPGETTVAVDLGPGRTAIAVAAGQSHTCAILDTGQLRCWGNNSSGQLGQGNTTNVGDAGHGTTAAVDLGPGRTAVAVTAGFDDTCAILDTGQLRCWGGNGNGQLGQGNASTVGDGSSATTTVPVDLGAGRTAVAVAAGDAHTCAILDTGQLRCWGFNGTGGLGQGTATNVGDVGHGTTVAVDLGPGRTAVSVTAGFGHTCAVLDTGQLRCWGGNGNGQLGQGNITNVGDVGHGTTIAVDLGPGRTALAASGGSQFSCAVLDTRQLRCWGHNGDGRLGQGGTATYGDDPGETPAALPAIGLGGQLIGRDTDGDGTRDAVDACPTVAGALANGCAAPTPPPPAPEAVLKGTKVVLDTVLVKTKASAKCPAKATVAVKSKSSKGTINVTKQLRTKTVAAGCRVKGKISLHAKPKKTAQVKVTVSGKKLKTKHLIAVRL